MNVIGRPNQEIYNGESVEPKRSRDRSRRWRARSIVFALDQPPHVRIAEMMILPVNRY
jgi:hypothetical protein